MSLRAIPPQPEPEIPPTVTGPVPAPPAPRYIPIERQQDRFCSLVVVWIYAYSRGLYSAREIERQMEHEPTLRWLTGLETVNHHTLSDFRVAHGEALRELFTQVPGMLTIEGLITLERVATDGTKIRANVNKKTFTREQKIREHLQAARAHRRVGTPGGGRADHQAAAGGPRTCPPRAGRTAGTSAGGGAEAASDQQATEAHGEGKHSGQNEAKAAASIDHGSASAFHEKQR